MVPLAFVLYFFWIIVQDDIWLFDRFACEDYSSPAKAIPTFLSMWWCHLYLPVFQTNKFQAHRPMWPFPHLLGPTQQAHPSPSLAWHMGLSRHRQSSGSKMMRQLRRVLTTRLPFNLLMLELPWGVRPPMSLGTCRVKIWHYLLLVSWLMQISYRLEKGKTARTLAYLNLLFLFKP